MSHGREPVLLYEWKVVAVADDALESTLNRYQAEWEIFGSSD